MAGWDWSQILTVGGKQYVAKRSGSAFMEMSRDYPTDEQADASTLGRDIIRRFTAHIPHEGGRPPLGTIILESSKGVSTASGDGSDAEISRAISTDNVLHSELLADFGRKASPRSFQIRVLKSITGWASATMEELAAIANTGSMQIKFAGPYRP